MFSVKDIYIFEKVDVSFQVYYGCYCYCYSDAAKRRRGKLVCVCVCVKW